MLPEHFGDESAARAFFESRRWPEGVVCPYCERPDDVTRFQSGPTGLFKCNFCQLRFGVKAGTIFENSRLPLHKWLIAIEMFCTQPNGVSIADLQRSLRINYKTAWRVRRRILDASRQLAIARLSESAG